MHRHKLGELVRQRRQELSLSIRGAASSAGVDRATWTALEEGTRVTQDRHYAGIERVLSWPTGTIESIVSGTHPWVTDVPTAAPDLLDENERLIWAMDALPEDLRRTYLRLYRERRQANTQGKETA